MKGIYKLGIAVLVLLTITTTSASAITEIGDNIIATWVNASFFNGNGSSIFGIIRSNIVGQVGIDDSQNASISALQADDTNDRSYVNLTFIPKANATACSGTDKSVWNGTAFVCATDQTSAGGITNETVNPFNMNGSNISTGTIPTARYLAAVNASALLASIAQVTGLQTIISSLQGNDTVHDSSISTLQANDTADRAYLNNTFPGSTFITTLGTIATGIWQGTGITAAYITSVNGSNISTGTIPTARYLDAVNTSANLYNVNGSNITTGTIPTARYLGAVNTSANLYNINVSNATSGTLPISRGGTGQTSALVAGGVLYGSSTTAAGVTAAGTSGQFLQSAGAAAPTWVNLGALSGVTVLTTASVSPYTVPAGVSVIEVELIGGGGGGAGGTTAANPSSAVGGGGGGGAYTKKRIATSEGTTYTFVVGTGGAGGSTAVGTAGGQTQFNAAAITANGGSGGTNMASGIAVAVVAGGAGGTAGATGDVNVAGDSGGSGYRMSATLGISGTGGSSFYGSQSHSVYLATTSTATTGTDGALYGSGGAGGSAQRSSATVQTATGGAGANGVIIIREYR